MAFSSLNSFSGASGLGVSSKKTTKTYTSGLNFIVYDGYFNDDVSYTSSSILYTGTITQISSILTGTNNNIAVNGGTTLTIVWTGYFKVTVSDTYTFSLASDDASYLWIGETTYSTTNTIINNGGSHAITTKTGTKSLTADVYYPIRIIYGENTGSDNIIFSWYRSGNTTSITNGTGYFYY
jgi:hypothetical protein